MMLSVQAVLHANLLSKYMNIDGRVMTQLTAKSLLSFIYLDNSSFLHVYK